MSERDVKGIWIPIEIWEDPQLTLFETALLAEIDSLDKGEGCWKTDQELAKRMRCSLGHLSNKIASLRARKYLKTIKSSRHRRYLRTCFSRHRLRTSPKREIRRDLSEKLGDKIIKDDLRENSGGYSGGSSSATDGFFSLAKIDDPFILNCVARLEKFIRKARKISPQFKRTKWIDEFRMLLQSMDGNKNRLNRALKTYTTEPHDEFTPHADSAESFRKKFMQIERWTKEHFNGEWVDRDREETVTLPNGDTVTTVHYNLEGADI